VWGIVGAILSVPLTTSIKVYLENIDHPGTCPASPRSCTSCVCVCVRARAQRG
jgi:hypothetical protein